MTRLISVVALVAALISSSASPADEVLYPPWDGWDSWRNSTIQAGWDYGYETGTLNDASVTVDLVSVAGVSTTNQWCWNYESWTAPADDYYRFTFNYNASGWARLSGASVFGDASWITMTVVLRIVPSWTTWEEGPYRYSYLRTVAATSGIPYFPLPPYEYDEDVYVTTGPIWFQEGDTVSIGGGMQILPTCVSLIGFVSILSENTGQLASVQIARENPPTPILAVDPDPPAHVFGQNTRIAPVEWTFNIWNSGTGTLTWNVSSDSTWISLSPNSGSSTGEWDPVTVTVDTSMLDLGDHGGFINIHSNAGSDLAFIGITIINVPPGAEAGGPYSGVVNDNILFNASASFDGDGTITGYRWDWDNNGTWDTNWLSSPTATHSFATGGSHTVALEVMDNEGAMSTDTCVCNISVLTALVKPDGTGDYPTIQAAVNAAANGAVIMLGNGTFTGIGNRDIDYLGKAITVRSQSDNPNACIIDCQGSPSNPHRGFRFHSGETSNSVLRGLTVTGAYVSGYDDGAGGGVCCLNSSPAIAKCVLSNNRASDGGGLYVYDGYLTMLNCAFNGNSAASPGMGAGAQIYADYGAGATFTNCAFQGNYIADGPGGAVMSAHASVNFAGCVFRQNSALWGGAFHCWDHTSATFSNCVFTENTANGAAGALGLTGASTIVTLADCTLVENSAASGSQIKTWTGCSALIQNSIIAFGLRGQAVDCEGGGGVPTFTCCDVYGNAGGDWVSCIADQYGANGNISGNPLFCDPSNGDYRLCNVSPCAPAQQPSCGLIGALEIGCVAQPPVLSNYDGWPDGVDPDRGGPDTTFTFKVHYFDPEGTSPSAAQVFIDGGPQTMTGGASGTDYSLSLVGSALGMGTHGYHFYFEDGAHLSARLPASGEWQVTVRLAGDMNCDGVVDFDDINPFVLALTSHAAYTAAFPNCDYYLADCNGDGYVDFDDINPFIAILSGG